MNSSSRLPISVKSRNDLIKQLTTGKLLLNPLWKKSSYRIKFLIRTYLVYPKTLRWLDELYKYPHLGDFLSRQTNLPCKLHRPYLTSCITKQENLNALIYHHQFLSQQSTALINAFYDQEPYQLATIKGKNDQEFYISIFSSDKFSREGELTIEICNQEKISLINLTFSVIEYQQKSTLFIAGLQGATGENARKLTQQATKACFGVFPKRLGFNVATQIAKFFNLEQIIAVSNKTHIYNNWRYRRRYKKLFSDYDDFWNSLDGKLDSRGLFHLPLTIERKALEDIASKKRSEYQQRYTLLDQLINDVSLKLNSLKEDQ